MRVNLKQRFPISLKNLQRCDLFAIEREDELKLDRTAWEITGQPIGDDGLAVLLSGREWFDGVLILLFGLNHPFLDRGQALDRFAFIPHERALGKALRQYISLTSLRRPDIRSDPRSLPISVKLRA